MKIEKIIIEFKHFGKLRLQRYTDTTTQTDKATFDQLEYLLRNDQKSLEKLTEEQFNILDVEIVSYRVFKYKWWEFWK